MEAGSPVAAVSDEMRCVPLVSILTPVYNAARYLPETLASVRAQTFPDWEHLLVDDGSTDNSRDIAEEAARGDARIRVLRTSCNSGPSAARNYGLDFARGRFIAFLDADDLWLPEKLASCIHWMTAHGHGFIYHDYRHISNDGSRVGRVVNGPDELTLHALHTRRGTGCLTIMIDRERIPELRFPAIAPHHAEDFCLWTLLLRRGHIGHRVPLDLARYRLSPQSRSSNKLQSAANAWYLYRHHSKLPWFTAAAWWLQYAWNAARLHRWARPR